MSKITLQEIETIVTKIVEERDWDQFHTIKNLMTNLMCESTELMEPFTWLSEEESIKLLATEKRNQVEDEVADVFMSLIMVCQKANIDLEAAFLSKMKKIEEKYPVEKCKGINLKYTEL